MTFWQADTIQKELSKIASKEKLKKNTILELGYIYYLQKGLCSLEHISENGENKTLIYFKENSLMNFLPCLLNNIENETFNLSELITEEYSIRTCSTCHLLKVKNKLLFLYLKKKPYLAQILTDALTQNYINILCLSTYITNQPAAVRVSRIILKYSIQKNNQLIFPRYFTYEAISTFAALHIITVTKIFKALFKEKIISKTRHTIFIESKKELEKIANKIRTLQY